MDWNRVLCAEDEIRPKARPAMIQQSAGDPELPHEGTSENLGGASVCIRQSSFADRNKLRVDWVRCAVVRDKRVDPVCPELLEESGKGVCDPLIDVGIYL